MTRPASYTLRRPTTPAARRPSRRPTLRVHNLEDRLAPATFTVTNTSDSGPGSLRQAVTDANAAGDDVIQFDTGGVFASPQTISLLSALPTIESGGGALTVTGTGAANLTVRRDPAAATDFRLFNSEAPAFTLTGATLTGGNPADDGGAIRAGTSGNVITLDGVVLHGNRALGSTSSHGGAIYLTGTSYLNIRNSEVTGNTADGDGGGIYFFSGGSLVMDNTVVTGNTSVGGSAGGGGLYWFGTANATPPAGFTASTLIIKNSTFEDNRTLAGRAGGILVTSLTGTLLVENTTIDGNSSAAAGGGMTMSGGTITITGSSFTGNTAATDGGGISVTSGTALNVRNTTLYGNTAANSGGGIAVTAGSAAINVQNSTIVGNTANGTAATTGGGGLGRTTTTAGTVTIANTVIAGNTATAAAAGPDVKTGASGTTLNVNFSAIGTNTGHTLSGTSANNVPAGTDLKLGPLANWGGASRSASPLDGSPLIDAGSNGLIPSGLTSDQRGAAFSRTNGTVDIGALEYQTPFLPIALSSPPAVTTGGASTHTFTVTFGDLTGANPGIKVSSLVNNNAAVRVTGPGGFDVAATYVSIDNETDGTPRTVTYSFTPPGGTWDGLDNGTYKVRVAGGQVKDLDDNFVTGGLAGTFPVQAPYVVTTDADAGPGSLRQAIAAASANSLGEVVLFDPGFFNTARTISLQSALPLLPTAGGALTLTGPGATLLTVERDPDAPTNFRILDSEAPALTLTGLRLTGGDVTGSGGAINHAGTTALLTLDGVVIEGNRSSSTGGAVFVGTGNFLHVTNSTVAGNTSGSSGGGIYFTSGGGLVMDNVAVRGNAASSSGGGLNWAGTASATPPAGFTASTAIVRNSTFTGNTAGSSSGGGINISSITGTFQVQNTVLAGNRAGTNGGGLNMSGSGTLTVQGGAFEGNAAASAGGGLNATAGTVTVVGTAAAENTAGTNGGGLAFSASTTTLTVQNSTLARNTAAQSGGGLGVTAGSGTVTVQNTTVVGNAAGGTAANTGGGGIARTQTTAGTLTLQNTVVAGNTAAAAANGPDLVTGASGSTVNINFSAVGTDTGYTPSGTSANNVAAGTDLKLGPLANWGGASRTVSPVAGSPLIDAGSNALTPAALTTDQRGGAFARLAGTVDIGAVEYQAPFVPVASAAGPTVTVGGGTAYTFTVTYADPAGPNGGIETSTLIGNDNVVRVTGPGGFDVPATYVSIDDETDGTPRTVTYSITPPGGTWNGVDNGVYTIRVAANQVKDLDDNFVAGGSVGAFGVQTPHVVSTDADAGPGSLREAIAVASSNPLGEVVLFDPGFFNTARTISLLSALPQMAAGGGPLTITGPGADLLTVRRDPGAADFRLLDADNSALTVTGVRLTGGRATGNGGAINFTGVAAVLTLDGLVIDGNAATSAGGGVYVDTGNYLSIRNSTVARNASGSSTGGGIEMNSGGGLVMDNVTVVGNIAGTNGGGLSWAGTASATPPAGFTPNVAVIANSTFDGNVATTSGGALAVSSLGAANTLLILNTALTGNAALGSSGNGGALSQTGGTAGSSLALVNSTVAGNTAVLSGGGLAVTGGATTLNVLNSTIVGNKSGATAEFTGGGGIARTTTTDGVVNIANSVVAGNTAAAAANGPDIFARAEPDTVVNVNFSAVGTTTGFTASGTSGNNVAPGTDLKLAPLAVWGGSTRALAPLPGSPLIDAGSNSLVPTTPVALTTDQRGGAFARTAGTVDIGAVEAQAPFLPAGVATVSPVTAAGAATYTFTVTYSDPTGTGNGVKVASLINNNNAVRVSGPNGFDVPAAYVSIDNATNGSPRTVTYSIATPGGSWDWPDNGYYAVRLAGGQVLDLDDNPAAGGLMGSFRVTTPYVVTTTADSGIGSLRDHLNRAAADPANDTILFDPAVFATSQTIGLLTALPLIEAGNLTLTGPGADRLTVRRDPAATANFAIFEVTTTAPSVTIERLTITGGTADRGGGITGSTGALTVRDAVVTGNTGTDSGGIFVDDGAFLTLQRTAVTGNTGQTGGVYFDNGGSLLMQNSTIGGNTGTSTATANAGGLAFDGLVGPGGFTIENSTIAGNTTAATINGGGINLVNLDGTVNLESLTIAGNTAAATGSPTSSGGIRVDGPNATVNVDNSVVAANTGPADTPDIRVVNGNVTATFSLVGVAPPTGFFGTNNQTGSQGNALDPKLGPLQDNGGPAPTMAPLTGSPLRNAGSAALLPAGMTTDQRGTPFVRTFGAEVDIGAFEVQPPSVTVNQAADQADPHNGPVRFTVVFNAAVTGFTDADVRLTGSTVGGNLAAAVTGSGRVYTVTVTGMTGTGTVVASVPADAAVDGSETGNLASTSTDNAVFFDGVAPTVTVNQAAGQAEPTNDAPVSFTVRFSEPVVGFTGADVDLSESTVGGTLVADVTGSGQDYTVTVTGMTGTGTVVAKITAGGATDPAGNANAASTSSDNSVLFDNDRPTVTIDQAGAQADPTNVPSVTFDVHFNEPVTGFGPDDIDFTGSTVGGTLAAAVTGSGQDYTVTVTGMAGTGTVVAAVEDGAAVDPAGNTSEVSTSLDNAVVFDSDRPSVTIEQSALQPEPTNLSPVTFAVHFNEPVTGFGPEDVDLSASTVGGTLAAAVSGSGQDYTVTVTGMTGTGDVIASILNNAAVDDAGNLSFPSTSVDNAVLFDNEKPTVTIEQGSAQADPTAVPSVVFDVTFNEPVTGFGPEDVVLSGTAGGTLTAQVDGSGANYTVTVTGMTAPGTVVATVLPDAAGDPTGNTSEVSTSTDNSVLFDTIGSLQLDSATYTQTEDGGLVTVTVTRTGGSANAVSVNYATVDGTALAGSDFALTSGTLNWANGDTAPKTFTVAVTDDILVEGAEAFGITLSDPTSGATLGGQTTATVTITDVENGTIQFSQPTFSVAEDGSTEATITVTRTGGSDGAVSVDYATGGGTALAGADYTTTSGTLSWAAGNADPQTIEVPVGDDTLNEGRETVGLTLANPTGGARLGADAAANLVIRPSDGKVIVGAAVRPEKPFATFTDADGDIATVKLAGRVGTATVYLTDHDGDGQGPIELIEVAGTHPAAGKAVAATVTVTSIKGIDPVTKKRTLGDGLMTIGGVTGSTLKAFTAPKSDIIGDGFQMTGYLGTLRVKDVLNGADLLLDGAAPAVPRNATTKIFAGRILGDAASPTDVRVAAPLANLTAVSVGAGTITAPSVGTILVKGRPKTRTTAAIPGDFKSDLTIAGTGLASATVPALRLLRVFGAVDGSTITVGGGAGTFGDVGTVTVGSFVDSRLFAGYAGPDTGLGTFHLPSKVVAFNVLGKADGFARSFVIASTFRGVTLGSVTGDNAGTPFGFRADTLITRLAVTNVKFRYNPAAPAANKIQDFDVFVV